MLWIIYMPVLTKPGLINNYFMLLIFKKIYYLEMPGVNSVNKENFFVKGKAKFFSINVN